MKLNSIRFARSFIFGFLAFYMAIGHAETATYTFAVVPQFKPAQLQKEWGPILERMTRETGIKFRLVLASNIPKFEEEINKGTPDFALTNPYQTVLAVKEHNYIPMLRDKKPLAGIVVVRKDSNYKKVEDLNGTTIGFPAPNAFGASLYIRARLSEEHPIKFTPKYLNNHNLVFRHVLLGHVAAGGSVNSALKDEPQDIQDQLTVLYKTPDVAPHPIIVHPRVPESVRKSVMASLLSMQNDVEGRAILAEIRMPNLTDASFKNDYQAIEKLNIHKYLVQDAE